MEESKEARAVQYQVTQEMADIIKEVSDLGADISCLIIPSLRFLGNFILDNFTADDQLSGWYSSHEAVIEKLEKIAYDIEMKPRSIAWDFEKAIEAVHGDDKEEDAMWKKDTIEVIDRFGALFTQLKDVSNTISWRIDAERKAKKEDVQKAA